MYDYTMDKKIVYWLSRAVRIQENPALKLAYDLACEKKLRLEVYFFVLKDYKYANDRNMNFLLTGLLELSQSLQSLNIPLFVRVENPIHYLNHHIDEIDTVITEFTSSRFMRALQDELKSLALANKVNFHRVNTATVVPIHIASDKCEYSARTIRPKLLNQYQNFLKEQIAFTPLNQLCSNFFNTEQFDEVYALFKDISPHKIDWLVPGENAAHRQLNHFINDGLNRYHLRNEISANATSKLSAYLHFGMISPRTIVKKVLESKNENAESFIEQVLVRRELAENFCFYRANYDSLEAAWPWAINTLKKHEIDKREYIYSLKELEFSNTHDIVWNECQRMVRDDGYLHGYLRMYWAKQVLLWSHNAQEAIDKLIYLNDTYMIDGRDPNGYVGILWSIAGVHDRPWFEKDIIGLIRPMSANGTLKKSKLHINKESRDFSNLL